MKKTVVMIALIVAVTVQAQDQKAQVPQISVSGEGKVKVVPDQAVVTVGFQNAGKDAKEAILSYEVIAERNGFFLLEVIPETGRQHQIRVQLAAIGCPIVGDVKYGFPTPNEDASICLHARKLEFIHPVSKVKVVIKAKSPNKNAWNKFNMN
jgi:23S rRNA pseudouridine1911/1915/1917 synthase